MVPAPARQTNSFTPKWRLPMPLFHPGDAFPLIKGFTVNRGLVTLPEDIPAERYAVVLAYRAHW